MEAAVQTTVSWLQQNTTLFIDRGLVPALVDGGNMVVREAPSLLSNIVRTGAKVGIPIVGAVVDFGMQKAEGKSTEEALIKTAGHTGAGLAGAAIGTALGGPVGTGVGFVLGVGGAMAFDWVYDHKDGIVNLAKDVGHSVSEKVNEGIKSIQKEADKVGEAVSGFFGNLGSVFG
ncbi:hypothetical protein MFLO_13780 [Listeria floridensis FSL S10-1187]|uniref:Uncharacterized protein n=1 Tax=Listeria floridensis FSL S10-1187 TaxID=1265817 RepID=A0ABN0RCE1_9LIST|nr:hypothetical protein MFLO_13780 [Listeria floridensis FSL S10-1187]